MENLPSLKPKLHESDEALLFSLRNLRRKNRQIKGGELTFGQHIADTVASIMGSWRFITFQSMLLALWVFLNVTAYVQKWDPYPFILLNLVLSFQAAYTAPFIMMSQNRQQDIDRKAAQIDYQINVKAELEIELLHQKIDQLREMEILTLTKTVQELTEMLQKTNLENAKKINS